MSNKPKGVAIHPDNELSEIELKYNRFIRNMVRFARTYNGFGKHVGSKSPSVLKHRTSN